MIENLLFVLLDFRSCAIFARLVISDRKVIKEI